MRNLARGLAAAVAVVVCASPAYLERRGIPKTPQDLSAHECIAHMQRTTPREWHFTTPTGGKTSVQVNGRIAVTNSMAVRACALEGLGIIELNSYIVGPDIGAGRLVRLLDGYQSRELSVYAVFPQRRFLAPKVRVFIDALLALMTPEPSWDSLLIPPEKTQRAHSLRGIEADAKTRRGYAQKSPRGNRAARR